VAKTTIYRSWPNRPTLVVDLLAQMAAVAVPLPGGRDAMRALRREFRQIAKIADGLEGRLLISLLGEAQRDPAVRTALLERIFHPRTEASAHAVRRAQASGTLRRDVPPSLAVDLLVGPLFYRMFVQHAPVTEDFVKQVFQHVLAGLGPRSARRK
jgi:AcrR family transcriptional regulator